MRDYKAKLTDSGKVEVVPTLFTHCIRCGRLLRTYEAKQRGYGVVCWEKRDRTQANKLF